MKTAIAVLNIGGKSLRPRSRNSMTAAADRWGAEFVEIREPIQEGVHHYWQKAFVCKHLEDKYDRVLQLDADMLVRFDTPCVFDIVPEESFGVVSARQVNVESPSSLRERQLNNIAMHRDVCIRHWARVIGLDPCPDSHHLNGGFFCYSPKHHSSTWEHLRSVGESVKYDSSFLPEQSSLSVILWNSNQPQTWLPQEWNLVGARNRRLRPEYALSRMNAYIYHFTGSANRRARIANTCWWKLECDEIAERLPDGGVLVEVGVNRGVNACCVGHRRPNAKLILVDGWGDAERSYRPENDHNAGKTSKQWKEAYASAVRLTAKFNTDIIRALSVDAARQVEDGSCDVVYIDADHTEEQVAADIEAWLPKVKKGGWLGGHDYNPPKRWKNKWGVAAAVSRLLPGHTTGAGSTWWYKNE